MTNEKVIEILQEIKCDFENKCCSSIDLGNIEATGLAISALEYRTPKNPIYDAEQNLYFCPNCKRLQGYDLDDFGDFCELCGQAIDRT